MEYFLTKKIIVIFFKSLIFLVFCFLVFLGFSYFSKNQVEIVSSSFRDKIFEFSELKDYSTVFLKIGDKIIETELVFSQEAMYLGLSGRENLLPDKGMLFVFGSYGEQSFSMRNMNFPLDLVFLKDGKVLKVFSNLVPEDEIPRDIYQYGPADMVIELSANYFKDNNLKEGMFFDLVDPGL